ncbi:hypothetical protein cypCar_00046889 [Cyprinus carpio]|nr:hypothetical protein cypCar_00046889 [Cyprinus carpio]
MAESAASRFVDQFSCPVCLDGLKEPVTIPCGHSYCMSCITDCWGQKEQGSPYRCPQCRESFSQRPLLKKNTLIAEMMETLQQTALQTAAVDCDVCTTEKSRAVKSCLQCLASFCQTHLQLHYQSPAFMKHKLVEASRNIQENICLSHGKLLEIYCQDDRQCICCLCTDDHKGHSVVSLDSEWTSKKEELKETKVLCQKLIQERERGQRELSEALKLLTSCQSVCPLPTFEKVPMIQHTLFFKDISISMFKEVLEDVFQQQTARISREVSNVYVTNPPEPKTQNDFLQYFCDLHLDLNTAHSHLKLSEDNRKILSSDKAQQYPDQPERFNERPYILSRDGLYGRFYWEIECSGDEWAVGVCYSGIRRKGSTVDCALGFNKMSWRLGYYLHNFSFIHDQEEVPIPVTSRVGVFLDHGAGTLSFYRVSDTMTLLHRVQTTFTEPLYPAFKVGYCSSVRIIELKKDQVSTLNCKANESCLYERVRFNLTEFTP